MIFLKAMSPSFHLRGVSSAGGFKKQNKRRANYAYGRRKYFFNFQFFPHSSATFLLAARFDISIFSKLYQLNCIIIGLILTPIIIHKWEMVIWLVSKIISVNFHLVLRYVEEIIRRRLLFDGEGTGDERRLNVLLKGFLAWCNSTDSVEET